MIFIKFGENFFFVSLTKKTILFFLINKADYESVREPQEKLILQKL